MRIDQAVNIEDLHRKAKRRLPKIAFDFIEGGLEDERGLETNTSAFHKHRLLPRYPLAARRAGVQGAAVVRGIVRRDGTIDNVEVIKDLPNGLGEAAREAVSDWRFRPASFQGEPIDVYYTVTVNFRLTP